MKRDPDYFEGQEPELIYIARRLKDATRLEGLLDEAGVDYGSEPDDYVAGTIFRTTRVGVFFYVLAEWRDRAVDVLLANGFIPLS